MGGFFKCRNCCRERKLLKGRDCMASRMEELINSVRLGEIAKKQEESEKKKNLVVGILAVIGVIAAMAAIAFAVYKDFEPYYIEDFDDDDDDFDDDFEEIDHKVEDAVEKAADVVTE